MKKQAEDWILLEEAKEFLEYAKEIKTIICRCIIGFGCAVVSDNTGVRT